MGYFTYYELEIQTDEYDDIESTDDDLVCRYLGDYSEDAKDGVLNQEMSKWPSQEADMFWISRLFPNYIFTLYGDGDDGEDLWVEYWLDGKYQHETRIITPEFNRNELIRWDKL